MSLRTGPHRGARRHSRSAGRAGGRLRGRFDDDLLEQRFDLADFLRRIGEIGGDGIDHLPDIPDLTRQGLYLRLDLIRA